MANKPKKGIKWNPKNSVNPKEGRKRKKGEKSRWEKQKSNGNPAISH